MKSSIAAVILNSGLLIVVVVLLSAPLLMGQLLGEFESGALGITTTDSPASNLVTTTTSNGIAVYPNVSDFTEYAAFTDEPVVADETYQTAVTFTAFAGQQAAYNSLFTVYNTSNHPLSVSVEGGKLSSSLPTSQVWLSIVPDGGTASTLVTEAADKGSTEIRLAQTTGFTQGKIVANDQVLTVDRTLPTSIRLTSPLPTALAVGQRVYFGPIFYNKSVEPTPATSQVIQLQPQQKAIINLAVATAPGETATTQSVLPMVISAQ